MSKILGHHISNESVLVQFSDGTVDTLSSKSVQYLPLVKALHSGDDEEVIRDLFDMAKAVKRVSEGKVSIEDGQVLYDGKPVHSNLASKILRFVENGHPWKPLARFLENLKQNPSKRSVDTVYEFLQYMNLAITEDGCLLAYKAVRNDWTDKHSGKFDNRPGTINRMDRSDVCDDPRAGCSVGFHVGSLDYAKGFGYGFGEVGGDRLLIVKVNPKNIVCVPFCSSHQKVRTCEYEVVREYTGPLGEYEGPTLEDDDLIPDEVEVVSISREEYERLKKASGEIASALDTVEEEEDEEYEIDDPVAYPVTIEFEEQVGGLYTTIKVPELQNREQVESAISELLKEKDLFFSDLSIHDSDGDFVASYFE